MINAGIQEGMPRAGMIRCGDQDTPPGKDKPAPRKLEAFRFTSHSLTAMEDIAGQYGGEPRPWGRQWEVYSQVSKLDILLPPGELVVTQWMEMWTGGGMARRCDGITMRRPELGVACMCPQPADPGNPDLADQAIQRRKELAARKTPAACKPYTRFAMILADITDIGVWGLLTKSEQAAAEIRSKMKILHAYSAQGIFLPAEVAMEWRKLPVGGVVREFTVPVLRIGATLRELAEQTGRAAVGANLAAQLPPRPGALALTAGPAHIPIGPAAAGPDIALTAQDLADRILTAERRPDVEAVAEIIKRAGRAGDLVWAPPAGDGDTSPGGPRIEMKLSEAANNRWRQLPAGQPASA